MEEQMFRSKSQDALRRAKKTPSYAIAGIVAAFLMAVVPVKADTYTMNTDNCSAPGCLSSGVSGSISVTQDGANTVLISVTGSGFGFVDSAGGNAQFFFNVLNDPTISVTNLTSGWQLISTSASATDSLGGSGWGFDYALTCFVNNVGCGPGGSNPKPPPLTFDVTAAGLTPASFFDTDGAASPVQFAADIKNLTTGNTQSGNTGLVGFTRTGISTTVPEPISLSLVGSGLVSLFFLRRRVRG
jgi:hypothetical protein